MKYPNQRYGSNQDFVFYCYGKPVKIIAKILKRSEKTIKRYLSGECKIPWWINEYLRLADEEQRLRLQYMSHKKLHKKLGIVRGEIIEFPTASTQKTNKTSLAYQHTEQYQSSQANKIGEQLTLRFHT